MKKGVKENDVDNDLGRGEGKIETREKSFMGRGRRASGRGMGRKEIKEGKRLGEQAASVEGIKGGRGKGGGEGRTLRLRPERRKMSETPMVLIVNSGFNGPLMRPI